LSIIREERKFEVLQKGTSAVPKRHRTTRKRKGKGLSLDTETRILMAAERIFGEKGFAGARVHEIAKVCRVTPAMINYYYGGKENLYRTVIENFFLRAERLAFSVMALDIGPEEKLKRIIESGIDLLSEKPHMSRILMREFVDSGRYTDLIVKRYLRDLFSSGSNPLLLGGGWENRSLSDESMHVVFNLLGCMVFFFICGPIVKGIWNRDIFSSRMIQERKEEVIRFAFEGLGGWFRKGSRGRGATKDDE